VCRRGAGAQQGVVQAQAGNWREGKSDFQAPLYSIRLLSAQGACCLFPSSIWLWDGGVLSQNVKRPGRRRGGTDRGDCPCGSASQTVCNSQGACSSGQHMTWGRLTSKENTWPRCHFRMIPPSLHGSKRGCRGAGTAVPAAWRLATGGAIWMHRRVQLLACNTSPGHSKDGLH
jgi:hypothetical protein